MRIFELTHIGEFHTNHNEDFLVVEDVGESKKLLAVMDGCSSGKDSHFASTLIGKLLGKIARQEAYREFAERQKQDAKSIIKTIALRLFEELRDLNRLLDLRSDEILSTLILGIIDEEKRCAELLIVGDGVIHANGITFEFENDNKPDYIGYHLMMDKHLWFQTKTERKSIDKLEDLTISTDGIYTFRNHDGRSYRKISQEDILNEFFKSQANYNNDNKLKKSLLRLKDEYGLMPSDDLTMIRISFIGGG